MEKPLKPIPAISTPQRQTVRRLAAGLGIFVTGVVILAAVIAFCYPQLPRLMGIWSAQMLYRIYDPWTTVNLPPTGTNTSLEWTRAIPIDRFVQRPDVSRVIRWTNTNVQIPADVIVPFFHPENISSPGMSEFLQLATPILADASDPWQISNRIRGLAGHAESRYVESADPRELMRAIRKGIPLTCRPFSILHTELCAAKGYVGRVLGLSTDGTGFQHAVSEIYVPGEGWVVIDCDFNVAYRSNGRWLNALDLHRAWLRWVKMPTPSKPPLDALGIELVKLGRNGTQFRQENMRPLDRNSLCNLPFYQYVFYPARNNYLSGAYPKGHPIRTGQWVLKAPDAPHPAVAPEAWVPEDVERELYWPVGQVAVRISAWKELPESSTVRLVFSIWLPNFERFRVNDGERAIELLDGTYDWDLHPGDNHLSVAAVTSTGLAGAPTVIKIKYLQSSSNDAEKAE